MVLVDCYVYIFVVHLGMILSEKENVTIKILICPCGFETLNQLWSATIYIKWLFYMPVLKKQTYYSIAPSVRPFVRQFVNNL